jgi:hypothetical protein
VGRLELAPHKISNARSYRSDGVDVDSDSHDQARGVQSGNGTDASLRSQQSREKGIPRRRLGVDVGI